MIYTNADDLESQNEIKNNVFEVVITRGTRLKRKP